MVQNVTLIGMPGVGKSTIGVLLARRLGFAFMDTDLLIQDRYGKNLQAIVDELGQSRFRQVEEDLCSELEAHRSIIATGGSVVYYPRAMEHLGSISAIVWLQLDFPTIEERIAAFPDRGLAIEEGQTLMDLFEERVPLYQKYATHIVDTGGLKPHQVTEQIATALGA